MARASSTTRKRKRILDGDGSDVDDVGDNIAVTPRAQAAPRRTRLPLRESRSQANVAPPSTGANTAEPGTTDTTLSTATTSTSSLPTPYDGAQDTSCYHCRTRGGRAALNCRFETGQTSCVLCLKEKKGKCRMPTQEEAQKIAARCDRCKIRGFKTCDGGRPACDTCIRNKTPNKCWEPPKKPATVQAAHTMPVPVTDRPVPGPTPLQKTPTAIRRSDKKRRKLDHDDSSENVSDDYEAGDPGHVAQDKPVVHENGDAGSSQRLQHVIKARSNSHRSKASETRTSLQAYVEHQAMDGVITADNEDALHSQPRNDTTNAQVAESNDGGHHAEQEMDGDEESDIDSVVGRHVRDSIFDTPMLAGPISTEATSVSESDGEAHIQLELQQQTSTPHPDQNIDGRSRRSRARVSYVEPAMDMFSDQGSQAGGDHVDVESDESDAYMSNVSGDDNDPDEELDLNDLVEEQSSVDGEAGTEDEEEVDIVEDTRPAKAASRRKPNTSTTKGREGKGIDFKLAPIDNVQSAFNDMTHNALGLGLDKALQRLKGGQLNVATMCSGTESPLLALEMISQALQTAGHTPLVVHQKFAAEIDVFKQAFIERNQAPDIIFRDVRDFIPDDATTAITAYGAEVPIPSKVHMLIAGFVCKDLSRLNSKQKGLDEEGESGDTFRAVYGYAKRFRPAVVLLENVKGLATLWEKVVSAWDDIDYEAAWLIRDTKRYYIPQTRERMYMIAIDRGHFGKGADKAVAQWQDSMEKLQRQCSSPYESWLQTTLHETSDHSALVSEVNWDLCKLRYDHIRSDERLGVLRPVTRWSENGTVRPPSFANRAWYNSQSSRVYDAIDVAHLQAAKKGYDSLYKMAVLDVSQNVDRFKSALGLLPCITPGGCDFATNRQEALSGKQLLLLQGMPMNKLLFGTETQKECQDMAGNAMTTTVIGASLLSALICGNSSFRSIDSKSLSQEAAVDSRMTLSRQFVRAKSMKEARFPSVSATNLNLAELKVDARMSARLCECEGGKSLAKSSVQVCSDCGHTACERCAGNPRHRYCASIPKTERLLTPNDFAQKWRALLPSRLKFGSTADTRRLVTGHKPLDRDTNAYLNHISDSEIQEQSYCLGDVQRQDCGWTIVYGSTHSRLELVIGQTIDWFLFIECQPSLPANDSLRTSFQLPVARARVTRRSLIDLDWEIRIPLMTKQKLRTSSSGLRSSSWRSRLGLLDHKNETVPTILKIRSQAKECKPITGDFKLLPDCGTASSSLYKRLEGPTLYLFLDPNPLGESQSDGFIFSDDCTRKHYGESRHSVASIEPTWRPWHIENGAVCDATCTISDTWTRFDLDLEVFENALTVRILPDVSSIKKMGHDCSRAIAILEAQTPECLPVGKLENYSWMLEKAKRLPAFSEWHSVSTGSNQACDCAPAYPRILWSIDTKGSATPSESRKDAARFERAIKSRQQILHVDATTGHGKTEISVAMNVAALVHRASGRLGISDPANITTSWRMVTDHADLPPESFAKFYLSSNANDTAVALPPALSYLRNTQPRSLAWMQAQELGRDITITEVEEAVHVGLGWRAEGRAQTTYSIRGGVLADLPSFGKTVTCIALIQSDFEDDSLNRNKQSASGEPSLLNCAATLIVCPPHIALQWQTELEKFLGSQYEAYNVIVVQTFAQLQDLTIEDFQESSIVILSWNVFAEDGYIANLAHFTGMPEPNISGRRAFDTWLDQAAREIPGQLAVLQSSEYDSFQVSTRALLEERLDHDDFKAALPLKVQHGSAYVSFKATQAKQAKLKAQTKSKIPHSKGRTSPLSKTTHQTPLLHLFQFNRLVVDEYHYLNEDKKLSNVLASVCAKRIRASKRWVLSGTPALTNFSDVDQIASYLGISLGRYHYGNGVETTPSDKMRRGDQTAVEEFLSQTEMMSRQWHQARHERAQKFLNLFVRQNEPSLGHIPCAERIYPVELDIGHHAVYLELSQYLISQKMQIKKLQNKVMSDKIERLNASLSNSVTAEDALLKSALLFKTSAGKSALEHLTALRLDQLGSVQSELKELLRGFEGLKKNEEITDLYNRFKDDILELNWLGDSQANQVVRGLLKRAAQAPDNSAFPELRGVAAAAKARLVKKRLSTLRETARDLAHLIRSERFISNIKSFLEPLSGKSGQETFQCSSSDCDGTAVLSELRLITHCGHTACEKCLAMRADSETCVRALCNACVQEVHLVKITDLGSTTEPKQERWYGRKLQAIVHIISSFPKGDQGVVFAPNDETVEIIGKVLESHNIPFHGLRGSKASTSAKIIEDFKTDDDPEDQSKVLVLNMGSESAAGANLVNANHVLFIAPLLTKTQYEYDSAMAQAIARCRRYGQKKTVHIYHIIAQRTIDVDILEHRHKRLDGITTAKSTMKMPKATASKEKIRLVKNKAGAMALVPVSWLADPKKQKTMDLEETPESFASLINFSDTFQHDED